MTTDILQIAREFPEMSITVKAADLISAIDYCVERSRRAAEAVVKEPDRLLSRTEASQMLGVSFQTLNRWEKSGYLVPVRIGVSVKYWKNQIVEITRKKMR